MAESGSVVNSSGEQIGEAAALNGPLGREWWAVASGTITSSPAPKITTNFFASFATLLQAAGAIKGYGELSSGTFLPVGLSLTATSPGVATVEVLPGAKITYDSVKLSVTTNKAYINSLTRIKLSDAEVRTTMASAKAVLTEAKKMRASLSRGAFKSQVAQMVRG